MSLEEKSDKLRKFRKSNFAQNLQDLAEVQFSFKKKMVLKLTGKLVVSGLGYTLCATNIAFE